MKYINKEGDELWYTVGYLQFFSDGNISYNHDEEIEGFPFVTSDDTILGSLEITSLGVVDSSKLVEELGSKESATLGVSKWSNKGIPEGATLGTNLGNYE